MNTIFGSILFRFLVSADFCVSNLLNVKIIYYYFHLQSFSQPLVPRENITAWMNATGLVITALPVRKLTQDFYFNFCFW